MDIFSFLKRVVFWACISTLSYMPLDFLNKITPGSWHRVDSTQGVGAPLSKMLLCHHLYGILKMALEDDLRVDQNGWEKSVYTAVSGVFYIANGLKALTDTHLPH